MNILIADDDALITEGLKIILNIEPDFKKVFTACNGIEAIDICKRENIDVALIDIRMPKVDGVEATFEICKNTKTKVLILTTFEEEEYIRNAILNGASGYILKNNSPEEIKETIKRVHSGKFIVEKDMMNIIKEELKEKTYISKENEEALYGKESFTERESDIIKLISKGLSNREISKTLYISEGTVKNYISSILNKTSLEHRTQIAISYLKGEILL